MVSTKFFLDLYILGVQDWLYLACSLSSWYSCPYGLIIFIGFFAKPGLLEQNLEEMDME